MIDANTGPWLMLEQYKTISGRRIGLYGLGLSTRDISKHIKETYHMEISQATLTTTYNILNRTDKITITTAANRYLTYTYDATGTLLRKQQYDNNTLQTTTDYTDGFVFTTAGTGSAALAYFGMLEGRIRNNGGTLKPEYIITDQQGNARISFEDNRSGTAVVRQENSYYSFGLIMPGSPVNTPTTPNKNLYNGGAEWQNDSGRP